MTALDLFERVTTKVKEDLQIVSDKPDVKNIRQDLINAFSERFTLQESEQSDHIVLALDGRKNITRIESDIDDCIAKVLTNRERKMLLSVFTKEGSALIRIRRS